MTAEVPRAAQQAGNKNLALTQLVCGDPLHASVTADSLMTPHRACCTTVSNSEFMLLRWTLRMVTMAL